MKVMSVRKAWVENKKYRVEGLFCNLTGAERARTLHCKGEIRAFY